MKKLIIILAVIGVIAFAVVAYANPFQFSSGASSAVATSTVQYLTVNSATATSTPVVYDTYNIDGTNQTNTGTTMVANKLVYKLQVVASSTSSVFLSTFEFSDGPSNGTSCVTVPTACDWYQNNMETYAAGSIAIAVPNTYTYTYASTSQGLAAVGANANRGLKLVMISVPTRYVRVIQSISGANGSVWSTLSPIKERSE